MQSRYEQAGRSNDAGEGSSTGNSRDSPLEPSSGSSDPWANSYLQESVSRRFPDVFHRVDLSKMWLETCTRLQGISLRSQGRSMTSVLEECSRNFLTRFYPLCQRYFRLFANRDRCPAGLPPVSRNVFINKCQIRNLQVSNFVDVFFFLGTPKTIDGSY